MSTSAAAPAAPLAYGTHVTAGTKTVHIVGGHWRKADGTVDAYYPPCSATFRGKTLTETEAAVTCKTCAKTGR